MPQNLVARPRHLDYLLCDAQLGPVLYPEGVALLWHSLRGYAVLAAVGGRSEAVDTAERLHIPVPGADARVKVLVLLAPALPWYAAPRALAAMQMPLLVLAAEKDKYIPPLAIGRVLQGVPATTLLAFRVVANASHFFVSYPISCAPHQHSFRAVARPTGV